jgi:hypothetical protein
MNRRQIEQIRKQFVPENGISREVLENNLAAFFPKGARVEKKIQLGKDGDVGWFIGGGRVTPAMIEDLRKETLSAERVRPSGRPAGEQSRPSNEPSRPLTSDHESRKAPTYDRRSPTYKQHGTPSKSNPMIIPPRTASLFPNNDTAPSPLHGTDRHHKANANARRLSGRATDPAYAARHSETHFVEENFEDYREFQRYLELRRQRESLSSGGRSDSTGRIDQPSRTGKHESVALNSSRHQRPQIPGSVYESSDDSDLDPDYGGGKMLRSRHEGRYNDPTKHKHRAYADADGDPVEDDNSDTGFGIKRRLARHKVNDSEAGPDSRKPISLASRVGKIPTMDQDQTINPFRRQGKLLDLPMFLGKDLNSMLKINVLPDTGATLNVVSRQYLEDTNPQALARISKDTKLRRSNLSLPDGSEMPILGQLTIPCYFLDAPKAIMQVDFQVCVLANNIRVLVGKKFLETTKTLTVFAHRMIERCPLGSHAVPRVMSLTTPTSPRRSQLRILINSIPCLASPDTGSEIDLFSASFATELNVRVKALASGDPHEIQYVNGFREKVLGKVIVDVSIAKDTSQLPCTNSAIPIQVGKDARSGHLSSRRASRHEFGQAGSRDLEVTLSSQRTFYIVEGLVDSIILGQAFIYSIDAYNAFKYVLVENDASDCQDTLNGIFITNTVAVIPKPPSKYKSYGQRATASNNLQSRKPSSIPH